MKLLKISAVIIGLSLSGSKAFGMEIPDWIPLWAKVNWDRVADKKAFIEVLKEEAERDKKRQREKLEAEENARALNPEEIGNVVSILQGYGIPKDRQELILEYVASYGCINIYPIDEENFFTCIGNDPYSCQAQRDKTGKETTILKNLASSSKTGSLENFGGRTRTIQAINKGKNVLGVVESRTWRSLECSKPVCYKSDQDKLYISNEPQKSNPLYPCDIIKVMKHSPNRPFPLTLAIAFDRNKEGQLLMAVRDPKNCNLHIFNVEKSVPEKLTIVAEESEIADSQSVGNVLHSRRACPLVMKCGNDGKMYRFAEKSNEAEAGIILCSIPLSSTQNGESSKYTKVCDLPGQYKTYATNTNREDLNLVACADDSGPSVSPNKVQLWSFLNKEKNTEALCETEFPTGLMTIDKTLSKAKETCEIPMDVEHIEVAQNGDIFLTTHARGGSTWHAAPKDFYVVKQFTPMAQAVRSFWEKQRKKDMPAAAAEISERSLIAGAPFDKGDGKGSEK